MRPRVSACLLLASAFVLTLSASITHAADGKHQARAQRLSVDLSRNLPGTVPITAEGLVPLILEAAPQDRLVERVAELGGRIEYIFEELPVVAAAMPADRIAELLTDPQIIAVDRQKWVGRATAPIDLPGRGRLSERELHGFGNGTVTVPVPLNKLERRGGGGAELQTFLGYDRITGAAEVWEDAGFGAGTVVVVVDTGIFPGHPLIAGSVVGGFNLVPAAEEELIDRNQDGQPDGRHFDWDAIQNHEHGTFVSGLIAGHADLLIPPKSRFAQALELYSPESIAFVDSVTARVSLKGTAPGASLFGIKVFPYDGGDAPDARVAEAIDRVIRMKRRGQLDADVINLSLGGPSLFDGRDIVDRIVDVASAAGITVVAAAGNSGPALTTTGTPANSFTALAAGGAVDPVHTRVAADLFFPQAPPGIGGIVYPHDFLQVIAFSARGLTGDGRVKPDVLATAFLNFSATLEDTDQDGVNDQPGYGFGAGTSFATPTLSGAAALVVAYGRSIGRPHQAPWVANVLMRSADPIASFNRLREVEQGKGFLRLPEAFRLLAAGQGSRPPARDASTRGIELGNLGRNGSVSGSSGDLGPGETRTFLIKVVEGVTRIDFTFPAEHVSDTQNPVFGDGMSVVVHSAKRGGADDYVFGANLLEPVTFGYPAPEPGVIRVCFAADLSNVGPVSAEFRAQATSERVRFDLSMRGSLRRNGSWEEEIEVPEDLAGLGVVLSWDRDWQEWPTRDLDLLLRAPGQSHFEGGESLRSPELALIEAPSPGTWRLRVVDTGTIARGREHFRVRAKFFEELPPNGIEPLAAGELGDRGHEGDHGHGHGHGHGEGAPAADYGPLALVVEGATPNPFNPATTIRFDLVGASGNPGERIGVRIFDVGGRLVRTLYEGIGTPGSHSLLWDGRGDRGQSMGSGVYFYEIATPSGASKGKLVLAK